MSVDPVGHLAVATSHPRWIVSALHDALAASQPGRTWADTRVALLADNDPATVTLAARTISRADLLDVLAAAGVVARPGPHSRRSVVVRTVHPGTIAAVASGAAGVQDEGSQVVALALADAPLEGPDRRWLDMCAGPGGKAALLAAEAAERGASLTAVELHPHRADLVRHALRPIRGRHQVIVGDAVTADVGEGYDRVLVDAPCTGLGALRRRPEARWRRSPTDLATLVEVQRTLLVRALSLVRPGGLVLYATCSPHLAETDGVLMGLPRLGGRVVPLRTATGDGGSGSAQLRLWPHLHGTDGMFAALVQRVS
jgi:16S rRNA (cytosine967-C5)-methyltransferase